MPVKNTFIGASSQFYSTTGVANSAVVLANTPTLITPEIGAATGTSLTSGGTQVLLKETGDQYGATQFSVRNRDGSNGGILENLTIPLSDFGLMASTVITNISIDGSNNLTVTTANNWTVGQAVTLTGLTTATFLNSKVVTISTASTSQFTASFTHALYASAPDTGTAYVQNNFRMESRSSFLVDAANISGEIQFVENKGNGAGGLTGTIWFASGINGTRLASGTFNSVVGFQQNGTAASGHVLRGNGTNFIDAALAASDLSNGVTGSGAAVLADTPTLITPEIGVATGTSLTCSGTNDIFKAIAATTTQKSLHLKNTGGEIYVGVDNSTGSGFGYAYESIWFSNSNNSHFITPLATFTGAIVIGAATPTTTTGQVGFGTTAGFGNGLVPTAVTTVLLGTGSGPTTPQTIVNFLEIDIAGTKYWMPLMQ